MKFMLAHKTDGSPITPEMMGGIGEFMNEQAREGRLLAAEGLDLRAPGARLICESGKVVGTDAPFAEAKEVIGGFAILQTHSLDEAIELAKRFAAVCTHATEIEVRQVFEMPAQ